MAKATLGPSDAGMAARSFFAVQDLLSTPQLARFYTDMLINSPTTVTNAKDRLGLSKSTAYKYAHSLEELGIAEELEETENGSTLWRTEPVTGRWDSETAVELGPTVIAVYGATSVDDDLELFVDRHGKAALAPAIIETIEYLNGNTTRRGVAAALDVPAVEGIAVSQAIERVIRVVQDVDSALKELSDEIESNARAENTPYRNTNE